MGVFSRAPQPLPKPEELIFKLEFHGSLTNAIGHKVDLYVMYYDSKTGESITIAVPHGREDIAQYVQERLNK